jgi:hypothetical protein
MILMLMYNCGVLTVEPCNTSEILSQVKLFHFCTDRFTNYVFHTNNGFLQPNNQTKALLPNTLENILRRGVLDTTLCDKVCW